jgi:large subunit ribosomal protein L18
MIKRYQHQAEKRKVRTRSKIRGTTARPRLTVFRSAKQIYAQIIDDSKGITLAAANSLKIKGKSEVKGKSKTEVAQAVGQAIAEAAKKKKIKQIVFDRGPYKYHGRIKALAETVRKNGLKF